MPKILHFVEAASLGLYGSFMCYCAASLILRFFVKTYCRSWSLRSVKKKFVSLSSIYFHILFLHVQRVQMDLRVRQLKQWSATTSWKEKRQWDLKMGMVLSAPFLGPKMTKATALYLLQPLLMLV